VTERLTALEWREVWIAVVEALAESIPEADRYAPEEFGLPPDVIERIRLDLLDGDPVQYRARLDKLRGELAIRGFEITRSTR